MKGIPFNTDDPEVSGLDIFRKLVPIEAHEASSLYRYDNTSYIHSTHPSSHRLRSCFTAMYGVAVRVHNNNIMYGFLFTGCFVPS